MLVSGELMTKSIVTALGASSLWYQRGQAPRTCAREISREGNIDISLVTRARRDLHDIIPSWRFSSAHTPRYKCNYSTLRGNASNVHIHYTHILYRKYYIPEPGPHPVVLMGTTV